jgi:hypothetical protein
MIRNLRESKKSFNNNFNVESVLSAMGFNSFSNDCGMYISIPETNDIIIYNGDIIVIECRDNKDVNYVINQISKDEQYFDDSLTDGYFTAKDDKGLECVVYVSDSSDDTSVSMIRGICAVIEGDTPFDY